MRAHFLQHVPFEGLGSIGPWLEARGAEVTASRLHAGEDLPHVDDFDWLIAMGGPMGANDDDRFPWLAPERALLADAVAADKVVLGVCLGAQVLARALGAEVFKNAQPEIGWYPVEAVPGGAEPPFGSPIDAFHWHGDTFALPPGTVPLARSEACAHQAFALGRRVVGLQFHLEMTPAGVRALVQACRDEIRAAPWVQSEREILGSHERFDLINRAMASTLDWLDGEGP